MWIFQINMTMKDYHIDGRKWNNRLENGTIERKGFKIFTVVIILIATYKFIEMIPKEDEFDIHSLSVFPPDRKEIKQPFIFLYIFLVRVVASHLMKQ